MEPGKAKSLSMAYALQRRKAKTSKCMSCAAGDCATHPKAPAKMAEGGEVELEHTAGTLASDAAHARESLGVSEPHPMKSMEQDTTPVHAHANSLREVIDAAKAKKHYAEGGLVEQIMADRKPKAAMEPMREAEPDLEDSLMLESSYDFPDEKHHDIPTVDDKSLVGQILSERRRPRR